MICKLINVNFKSEPIIYIRWQNILDDKILHENYGGKFVNATADFNDSWSEEQYYVVIQHH